MLCNLQELQSNLYALLNQLSEVHSKLVNPIQAKKSNTHSFLIKIPKLILLVRVVPYLKYRDIVELSSTCVGMRKTIYSPIGWKILSRVMTPYPLIIKQIYVSQGIQTGKFQGMEMDNFPVHQIEGQKILKKLRAQCKTSLMQKYNKFKTKQEQHSELQKQLKNVTKNLKKAKMQKQYYKQRREQLQQKNSLYKVQLKLTNEGFADKIRNLDASNDEMTRQTNKLQNQKQALVSKIRQYQNEIENIRSDSQKSKLILKRIKNYLIHNQL